VIEFIKGKKIVGQPEHDYQTVVIPMTGVETEVCSVKFKSNGRQCYVLFIGNAAGVGGEAVLTFRVLVNGIPLPPYDGTINQWADPARVDTSTLLFAAIPCESGDKVQIMAKNSDNTTDWPATGRLLGVYTPL
jgi:hypothetical protein